MFDLGAAELLVIVIVAVLVIGPKDMPLAMRHVGRWVAQMRKLSGHFRAGLDAMVREAELEEMEKKWAAKNEKIMKEHPPEKPPASAEAKVDDIAPVAGQGEGGTDEVQMTPMDQPAQTAQTAEPDTAGKA